MFIRLIRPSPKRKAWLVAGDMPNSRNVEAGTELKNAPVSTSAFKDIQLSRRWSLISIFTLKHPIGVSPSRHTELWQVVHLYSIPIRERNRGGGSSQATLRHPEDTAYRCFLPDLTGFTAFRRAGPNYQHQPTGARGTERQTSKEEFSLARADCEYRAPLSPRLARPWVHGRRAVVGCQRSGSLSVFQSV